MKTQTMIQISGIADELRSQIRLLYIDALWRTATSSCGEWDVLMRRIHIMEVKLRNIEGTRR